MIARIILYTLLLATLSSVAGATSDVEQADLAQTMQQLAARRAHEREIRRQQTIAPAPEPLAPDSPPSAGRATITVGTIFCDYMTLQEAVNAANSGDTIHVAETTFSGAAATVNVNKALTIIGGYNAFCTTPSANRSTFNASGEADSVFEITADVTLENLILHNGEADGDHGGGIEIGNATVVLRNVIVRDSDSAFGGGVHMTGATLRMYNSRVYRNAATTAGGGVYCMDGTVQLYENSQLGDYLFNPLGNTAPSGGGAYLDNCTLELVSGSRVIGNDAATGGGVYAIGASDVSVLGDGAGIVSNEATVDDGGGVYLDGESDFSILAGNVIDNEAQRDGGGIYASGDALLGIGPSTGNNFCNQLECVHASDNRAGRYGGFLYINDGIAHVTSTYIERNSAESLGAAIYASEPSGAATVLELESNFIIDNEAGANYAVRLFESSSSSIEVQIRFNTMVDNFATGAALGVFEEFGMSGNITDRYTAQPPELEGMIVWGVNSRDVIAFANGASADFHCSFLPASAPFSFGTNEIGLDPEFVDPANDNYHIMFDSPAVDNCATPVGLARDIDVEERGYDAPPGFGNDSFNFGQSDAGADEARAHVGINGAPCAYETLRAAIDAAEVDDTLYVGWSPQENIGTIDKTLTIKAAELDCSGDNRHSLYKLNSTERIFELSGSATLTLIDMSVRDGSDVLGGNILVQENSRLILDDSAVFAGEALSGGGIALDNSTLELRNGSRVFNNGAINGAGIHAVASDIIIEASELYSNTATNHGGAIYLDGGSLTVVDTTLYDNEAGDNGGAVYAGSDAVVTFDAACDVSQLAANRYCSELRDNTANDGGGLYLDDVTAVISRTLLSGNGATARSQLGSAAYVSGGSATFANVLLTGNDATVIHAAALANLSVRHATFADNTGSAALYLEGFTQATVDGSIFWQSGPVTVSGASLDGQCNLGAVGGPAVDPRFTTTARGDYRLSADSPAINACADGPAIDLDGDTRPKAGSYDSGAFESPNSVPTAVELRTATTAAGVITPLAIVVSVALLCAVLIGVAARMWRPAATSAKRRR